MREVPALARGLRILELLADAKQPMRVAEVASRLDIPRSATYELINTLRLHRFIEQDSAAG
jgi:DNA-binding IclR family transcriptional regulator